MVEGAAVRPGIEASIFQQGQKRRKRERILLEIIRNAFPSRNDTKEALTLGPGFGPNLDGGCSEVEGLTGRLGSSTVLFGLPNTVNAIGLNGRRWVDSAFRTTIPTPSSMSSHLDSL